MLRIFLFLLIFAALNAGAYYLGTQESSREFVEKFVADPERVVMNLIDEHATSEQKAFLAEHLPKLYSFEYACQTESYDGKSVKPLIAGSPTHTFTKEQPILRCPRGLTASFEAGARVKVMRKLRDRLAWEIESGSAFIQSTGTNNNGIALQSGDITILLEANFPAYQIIARVGQKADISIMNGDFKFSALGLSESKGHKEVALQIVSAQVETQGIKLRTGSDIHLKNGQQETPNNISQERIALVEGLIRQYSPVLPALHASIQLAKTPAPGAAKIEYAVTFLPANLANAKCAAEFYPNGSAAPAAAKELPLKGGILDIPNVAAGVIIPFCSNANAKLFATAFRTNTY